MRMFSTYTHRLREKTMDDKLLYISIDNKQNYLLYRLKSLVQKLEPTNTNSIELSKVLEPTTLGTSATSSLMPPPSLTISDFLNALFIRSPRVKVSYLDVSNLKKTFLRI